MHRSFKKRQTLGVFATMQYNATPSTLLFSCRNTYYTQSNKSHDYDHHWTDLVMTPITLRQNETGTKHCESSVKLHLFHFGYYILISLRVFEWKQT